MHTHPSPCEISGHGSNNPQLAFVLLNKVSTNLQIVCVWAKGFVPVGRDGRLVVVTCGDAMVDGRAEPPSDANRLVYSQF